MKQKVMILVVTAAIATGIFVFSYVRFTAASALPEAAPDPSASVKPPRTMRAFRSEQDLKNYFTELAAKQVRSRELNKKAEAQSSNAPTTTMADGVASGKSDDKESITN